MDYANANPAAPPDLQSLLMNKIMGDQSDPVMSAMLSAWMNRKGEDAQAPALTQREIKLRNAVRRLRSDLTAADEMLLYISNVFGACHVCWGLRDDCAACRGAGTPGHAIPLREELLAWVIPALNRLGLDVVPQKAHARQASPQRNRQKEKPNHVR